jgi:predicted phosphodiesterase
MRLAILSDIHGNVLALEAVRADLARRGVDAVINLGDCVSGPLWPKEAAELLMETRWPTIRGNHDRWVAERPLEDLGASDAHARRELDARQREWLGTLPPTLALDGGVFACHARPDKDTLYLLEDAEGGRLLRSPVADIAARLAGVEARLVLCGHSHQQAALRLPDGRWVVNPGSVGCPAFGDPDPPGHASEAGSPSARYAVVELGGENVQTDLISVAYDHDAAARRAEANGQPGWAAALATGYVPRRPAA